MYRSSVKKFVQGLLGLIDEGRDIRFEDVADKLQDYTIDKVLEMLRIGKNRGIREGIPAEDWDEIMAYVARFTTAHGPSALRFFDEEIRHSFLCWLAAIGVELLSEI